MPIDPAIRTLPALFLDRAARTPWAVAYEVRAGDGWRTWTWREVEVAVRELSAGLIALGLLPGKRGAILAGTRLEWVWADLALLCAGLATTTLYPSAPADEWRFVIADADARVLLAEQAALDRLGDVGVPAFALDGPGLDDLRARGRAWLAERGVEAWLAVARAVGPDDLATLIYTSGTTGRPKGVRLAHDGWIAQAEALAPIVDALRRPDDKLYVWLPLAHAYGKVLELAGIAYGVPTAIDGELDRLARSLAETRPTWVPAVPRVFEKMRERMIDRARERGERAARVFAWAERVAIETSRLRRSGARVPARLRVEHAVAERLVYRRIREAFGGRVRGFLSGSAPLSSDLQHFFDGAGLLVLEGYGLTECSAVATANRPDALRFGTVGLGGPAVDVRIAPDGEVLLRGRAVMRGYHGLPDATAEAFADGWFRTGDLGALDADGFLRITGRIKELIVTSGGKNIAPAPIEAAIKARCPLIQEVVMVGDRRKYCTALITLDAEHAVGWARQRGLSACVEALAAEPAVFEAVRAAVDAVNATLASTHTIKAFALLERPFSIEGGELTPSLKVKRREVERRYADVIEGLYGAEPGR